MNVASGRVGHRSSALGSDSSDASFAGHRTGARITVVTGPYAVAIMVVALVLAAWAFGLVLANRPPGVALLAGGAVLEALLVGFLVGGIVQMLGSHRHFARAEFVLYLVASMAIPPAVVAWGWGERSRAGTAVVAVGFLIMPVMVIRVQQVWAGPVG
jgi:hypothetical protein